MAERETARFFDLFVEHDVENLLGSFEVGDSDIDTDSKRTAVEKLVSLIGEERFARLRAFEQAEPARRALTMLAEQLDGRGVPLTGEQRRRVLHAVVRRYQPHAQEPGTNPWLQPRRNIEVADLDQLVAICEPILSSEQRLVLGDVRDAYVEVPRVWPAN